ncbi:MAG: hypothetical protein Kow0027_11950 [Saprospiraceae bacterium]
MKKILLLLLSNILVSFTFSQTDLSQFLKENKIKTRETEEGIHYVLHEKGVGVYPEKGDYVMVRFKASLLNGVVFDQSNEDEPFIFQVGNREVIRGFDKAVRLLKAGGKGTFYIPSELGYRQQGVRDRVPPNSPLKYEIELVQIMDYEAYDQYMRRLDEREQREYEYEQARIAQRDRQLIQDYIREHHPNAVTLPSGMSYAIIAKGTGPKAKKGQRLKVMYEGFLLDGTPIENPSSKKNYEFYLGTGSVMPGWEEGLQHFNKGAEGWLIIPSQMAYGAMAIKEDNIDIPANAVLVFWVKVLEILDH